MENNVLIFGHKSPDTDTIMSSMIMENLEKKLEQEDTYLDHVHL